MIIHLNKDFNLKDTITCGQIFRFYEEENGSSYTIILKDRVVNVKKVHNDLIVDSNRIDNLRNIIINYFDLNRDYDSINNGLLLKDKRLENVISFCKGFKIIKQDPFETSISYIISSNNSVKSIRNSLNLISEKYGEKVVFNNKEYYLFPSYKDLKNVSEKEFRTFKVGFRDKYLVEFIKTINKKTLDLNKLDYLNSNELMNVLMSYNGIGTKVASCIALFAYQRFDVFPIDTWVKKMMSEDYGLKNMNEIINYTKKTFGDYSGLVIQYMFHYKRNKFVK